MQSHESNRPPTRSQTDYRNAIPQPTPASLIYAGIGAVVGLILGLIIAWVIWPVQWTNAWPADLSPEARAQYLAAVAESYVYYGDAQAAEAARNRLFNLNDNLADNIAEAQRFFVDNPQASSRVYISNLGQLAQALNVQSPDIIIDTPINGATVTPNTDDIATGNDVSDGVRAWVNWALTLLGAIILVGGGIYIVGRLNQRRRGPGEEDTLDDGGFEDEPSYMRPAPANTASTNPFIRPIRGTSGVSAPTAVPPRTTSQTQADDYGGFDTNYDNSFDDAFDEDDDDDLYASQASARTLDYRNTEDVFDLPLDDDLLDDPLDHSLGDPLDDSDGPYADLDDHNDPQASFAPQRATTVATPLGRGLDTGLDTELDQELGEELDDDLLDDETITAQATTVTPLAVPSITPSSTTLSSGRNNASVRTIGTYTFEYHAGIPDYDQSRMIVDPDTQLQYGDCGMGVNMKNSVEANNIDNAIALDVWLVDKKQEKSYASQDRVLLSEYVIDRNLEQTFTRERPNDPSPIIPQPGTIFQIKGPSLTLDCVVTEVSYIQSGPLKGMFQSLSIDMTVRTKL